MKGGEERPIDAIITWVDGSDPVHREKMGRFISGTEVSRNPGADPTRFASVNEIRYCVLSILRFAPFIRNIFILTDGQDPGVDIEVAKYFPDRRGSVRIVDHREVFRGYEQYLPTFNSRSISSVAWRIEGLADYFIYFNDDTFLVRDIDPSDWFINGYPVIRGRWMTIPLIRIFQRRVRMVFHSLFRPGVPFRPRASFHMGQWGAALKAGFRLRYLYFGHAPFAIDRRTMEGYFNTNPEVMEKNISFRFRSHRQFDFISLACHLELARGTGSLRRGDLAYLQPAGRSAGYLQRKIRLCENDSRIKFLCVQSLDQCAREDQELLSGWLEQRLGISNV